jgi:signal transduction histidine kinase
MENHNRIVTIAFIVFAALGISGLAGVVDSIQTMSLSLVGVVLVTGIPLVLYMRHHAPIRVLTLAEREKEAKRLRAAGERERAFYELTTTLSGTLDYRKVLEEIQNIGQLATFYDDPENRLVSAALVFEGGRSQLRVASARGLSLSDSAVTVPGKAGVLGLALSQSGPVFASLPSRDPELKYFAAFQDCMSILALPLRATFDYFGVLVFGSLQKDAFSEDYVDLLKAVGTQATVALQNAVLYQNILEEKERIVEVEEDARKKLARALHDGPTQSIAAIAMRINYIRRLVEKQNMEAHHELGKIEDIARRTTKEIRHMLFTLRPLILETRGLVAALRQLSEKMLETHDQNVIIEAQSGIERWLDSNSQGVIFYIVEEAVNNARKHAHAQHIWVRLRQRDVYFLIEIEDDGVGFDQASVDGNYESRGSLGMVNMRERTELVEGSLSISSQEGAGTKVSVLVPLKDKHIAASQRPDAGQRAAETVNALRQIAESQTQPAPPHQGKPSIPHATKRSPSS